MIRVLALAAALLSTSAAASAQSIEELQRIIEEREARIEELNRRIETLEKNAPPPASEEDEELNRALERTLVQQGGLVLRPGIYEVEPQASYAHWDKSRSSLRHVSELALGFRAGLGWDSQFQLRVPYVHVSTSNGSATGLGDVDVSLSRQFTRESRSLPSLVAALGWLSRTGDDGFDGGVPTGGGFNALQAGLTALKRMDPLVYFAGLSYVAPRSRQIAGSEVAPGDTAGLRLGGILAATAQTSLNAGLNLGFVRAARVAGQRVPDSDTVLGTFQVGFGTILTRRAMLNLSADLRVTGNVPNFRLNATLPIRF
jgi:hypothetical protein